MGHFSNKDHAAEEEVRLVNSIREGNKEAYGKLYAMYSAMLLGFINRIVGDQHRAEKVLQAAFLRYWQDIRLLDHSKERLFTWMTRIARQLALEAVKSTAPAQQKNRQPVKLVYLGENADVAVGPETAEETSALELVCFKGLTVAQAAQECGISPGELMQKLRNELKQLREVKKHE